MLKFQSSIIQVNATALQGSKNAFAGILQGDVGKSQDHKTLQSVR